MVRNHSLILRVRVGERLWLRRLRLIRNAQRGTHGHGVVMEMEDDLLELVPLAVSFDHT